MRNSSTSLIHSSIQVYHSSITSSRIPLTSSPQLLPLQSAVGTNSTTADSIATEIKPHRGHATLVSCGLISSLFWDHLVLLMLIHFINFSLCSVSTGTTHRHHVRVATVAIVEGKVYPLPFHLKALCLVLVISDNG
jgi:hypothetical protein